MACLAVVYVLFEVALVNHSVSTFLAVSCVMFEAVLVQYVVPDPLQPTTHSHFKVT